MIRLRKFIILVIALLWSCSTSWCQINASSFSTGERELISTDSVLVPISAIKVANAKMIELKYEKELNGTLMDIVRNDSVLIDAICTDARNNELKLNSIISDVKKERNIAIVAGSATSIILLLALILL